MAVTTTSATAPTKDVDASHDVETDEAIAGIVKNREQAENVSRSTLSNCVEQYFPKVQ